MSDSVAFALKADYEGTVEVFDTVEDKEAGNGREVPIFQGGLVALPEGEFDIGKALADGDGTIVVSAADYALLLRLDESVALKRVPVPDAPAVVQDSYGASSARDLRDLARTRGIDVSGAGRKEDVIDLLRAQDAAIAAGDQDAADNPGKGDA